jgi:hypothetical protein
VRGVWNWIVTRTADYGLPKQIELIDIVQILLIAFFVYHLIRWLQNTKAYTLMKGIFLIGVFVIIANVLKMQTILWLFGNIGGDHSGCNYLSAGASKSGRADWRKESAVCHFFCERPGGK